MFKVVRVLELWSLGVSVVLKLKAHLWSLVSLPKPYRAHLFRVPYHEFVKKVGFFLGPASI